MFGIVILLKIYKRLMKNVTTKIFGLSLIRKINLMCKHVKGKIIQDGNYTAHFYEYKANNKDLKKNGVSIYARFFTDTYEEAVEGFNMLVNKRIDSLQKEIIKLDNMLIKDK